MSGTVNFSTSIVVSPSVRLNLIRSSNLSVPTGVQTAIPWEAASKNTHNFWDVSNPTKINIPINGIYLFGIEGTFASATGNRKQEIQVLHGSHRVIDFTYSVLANFQMSIGGVSSHSFQNGDQLECFLFQNSTGSLDFLADPPDLPHFWMQLIGY